MTQFTDDDDDICVVSQFVLFVFTSSQLSPPLSTCSSPNSANPDQTFHNFSQGLSSTGKVELKRKMQVLFLYLFISQMFGREADEGSIYYCIEEGLLRQQTFFAPRSVVQQTKAISLSYYCYYHYYCLCQQSQASGPQRGERSQLYI